MRTRRSFTVPSVLVAATLLAGALAHAGAAADEPLRAGFAVRSIVPPQDMWNDVWHTVRRRPTGVLPGDGLWARAAFLDDGDTRLAVVSLDLLGFFYEDAIRVRDAARGALGDDVEVLVASTHTHSSIDTLGIYGPSATESGLHEPYMDLVRAATVEAIVEAAGAAVPVSARVGELPAPEGLNEYDVNRHPGSFDDVVHVVQFRDAGGAAVGTIVNWASHPELIDARSSTDPGIPASMRGAVLSSDYVDALRDTVEAAGGGTTVFLNGPIGAVTALAMPIVDPATGQPFPRRSVAKAAHVGTRIGETALAALSAPDAVTVADPALDVTSVTFHLRVDNPFILALAAAGTVKRQTYLAGVPVPLGREVRTQMLRVTLGPVEALTVPGELHPDVYTGGYLPREERANPDVPRERPIRPQMTAPFRFVIGLGMDELGYFVSATDYVSPSTVFPIYGEGVDRSGRDHYQETLSLGRDTARSIAQMASTLLGQEPEPDYLAYPGGFLDEGGRPLYSLRSASDLASVRGVWADTSDSGRYERSRDTAAFTPLPSGAPAAFGFLDAFQRDLGTAPSTRVRGAWVDGDGDGAFDASRDPWVSFDSYHVGKGELRP